MLNTNKKEVFSVVNKVIKYLEEKNVKYYLEEKAAVKMDKGEPADYKFLKSAADIIIIFGGDGTFLHTAHHFFGTNIPLLGINIGRLGFLTEIEKNEIKEALEYLIKGNYEIEERMILEGKIVSNSEDVYHNFALNDFVIHRGARSRLVSIDLYINNEIVNSYRADGIIIATPTGSTAYSLSSGGPIVNPQIRALLVTPICPHTLFIRPMVISDQEKVKIIIKGDHKMSFTADGSNDYSLQSSDEVYIKASSRKLSFIKIPDRTFYTILHKKMKVGLV